MEIERVLCVCVCVCAVWKYEQFVQRNDMYEARAGRACRQVAGCERNEPIHTTHHATQFFNTSSDTCPSMAPVPTNIHAFRTITRKNSTDSVMYVTCQQLGKRDAAADTPLTCLQLLR